MMVSDPLIPGPQEKTPILYEVEKGQKSESYLIAISAEKNKSTEFHGGFFEKVGEPAIYTKTSNEDEGDLINMGKESCFTSIGLTQTELQKYRDDPCWQRARILLLVLFFLAWIAMFLAAILVVILNPGCAPKQTPEWWQTMISYRVWVPSLQDSNGDGLGDLNGINDRLESLRKIGVQTLWITPLISSDNFDFAVKNHYSIDEKLGSHADFMTLLKAVHDKDMYLVMDLPLCTTSKNHTWFQKSRQASLPQNANYSDFYQWSQKSANVQYWKQDANSQIFYGHYESKPNWPVLNWRSSLLRAKMANVLNFWMKKGVDGFFLPNIEYLARTPGNAKPDWPSIYDILRDIRFNLESVKNETEQIADKSIVLFTTLPDAKETDKLELIQRTGVNLVTHYELAHIQVSDKKGGVCSENGGSVANCVNMILADLLAIHQNQPEMVSLWEFGNPYISRLATRVDSAKQAEILVMIQLLLPGANSFYYGDELGMRDLDQGDNPQRGAMLWDDSKNAGFSSSQMPLIGIHPDRNAINFKKQYDESISLLKMFKRLAKLRQMDDTLKVGQSYIGEIVGNAFILSRFRFDNDTGEMKGSLYVAVVNLGLDVTTVPLSGIPHLSSTMLMSTEIVAITSNVVDYQPREIRDFSSLFINVGPEQSLVFRVN